MVASGKGYLPDPVWGCVLIGGESTRMGRPKHLLKDNGLSWLEMTVHKLRQKVDTVVISGNGEIPASLGDIGVVSDVKGLQGPLAGVLALLRRQPEVSWLVSACDLPYLQVEALDWLLSCRRPGVAAVLPDLEGTGHLEPLLAYYDRSCRAMLEDLAAGGSLKLADLAGKPGVITPQPPAPLRGSWRNVNSPEEVLVPDNGCQKQN